MYRTMRSPLAPSRSPWRGARVAVAEAARGVRSWPIPPWPPSSSSGSRVRCRRAGTRLLPVVAPSAGQLATRQASGLALQAIAAAVPNLDGRIRRPRRQYRHHSRSRAVTSGRTSTGRTFHWGVREHGMAACLNGIAAHGGLRPFGSTFLVFSDYMKPSIRLAAIMRLPVIYIGTHDSIGVGEDGPTHQPVEHLAMLRADPEPGHSPPWRCHRDRRGLARGDGAPRRADDAGAHPPEATGAGSSGCCRSGDGVGGARTYCSIRRNRATGRHFHRHWLRGTGRSRRRPAASGRGVRARVVSMPSWELFAAQPERYRDVVLPPAVRARVAVEAAGPFGWSRWTTDAGAMVGMEGFGASAPGERLFQEFKLTAEQVAATAKRRPLEQSGSPSTRGRNEC